MSVDALARRRALLSGLGKGGAILAAATPIKSLAGSTVLTCKNVKTGTGTVIATVSGSMSAAHSFAPGSTIVQVPACGKKPSYWCASTTSWPSGCSKSSTYKGIFGDTPNNVGSTTTCMQILKNPTAYGTGGDCADWVAAWLNGASMYQSGNGTFPYPHVTGAQKGVLDWYKSADKANAWALFKTIQTATS